MDDIKLAMLGSKEAAKRLTDAGVLLGCPHCGKAAYISVDPECEPDSMGRKWAYTVVCGTCCATSGLCFSAEMARLAWNTRAAVEMEGMEGAESVSGG